MSAIVTDQSGGILRIALNRPAKKNAMSSGMYTTLAGLFDDAARDDGVRVVVWHGEGDAFTAGNDIKDFIENPPVGKGSPQALLMHAMLDFEKPLIAAVHGAAVGGGTTMLLHCDFVYAAENTRFQLPFINLALPPEFGSSFLLPLAIGHKRATEMVLLGQPFGAAQARDLGLVTEVVPDAEVLSAAMRTAQDLAVKPAGALQMAKRLLKRSFRDRISAAMDEENVAFSRQARSDEAKEAFAAFLEKRPPDFTETRKLAAAE